MKTFAWIAKLPFLALVFVVPTSLFAQGDCNNETTIDFSTLTPGTIVTNQLSDQGISLVSTLNANTSHPDVAIIFDSSNPSGGDTDLGTPHSDFDGPGEGRGEDNDTALGNLVIIGEDQVDSDDDGLVDDPDDEARGGDIIFNFAQLTQIKNVKFVDIEDGVTLTGFDSSNNQTFTVELAASTDNSVESADLLSSNSEDNARFVMSLRDSGALAEITICHSNVDVSSKPLKIESACRKKRAVKRRNRRRLSRLGRAIRAVLSKKGKRAMRRGRCNGKT